jgi:hypothetical protein
MIGAFLLGGGVVAVGYELAAPTGRDHGARSDVRAHAPASHTEDEAEPEATGDPPSVEATSSQDYMVSDVHGSYEAFPAIFLPPEPFDADAEAEYPNHGIVASLAVVLRERADLESPMIGILRAGTRFRADAERTFGGGCVQGWNRVFPRGWLCREVDVEIAEEPPSAGILSIPEPALDASLPYDYWRVKDLMTPFFHRLPTYTEQDLADAAGRAWYEKHGLSPMPTRPDERPRDVPAVVKEYQNAGHWVTRAGEEVKLKRRFLRTLRGAYARKYQLEQRPSSEFRGVLVSDPETLPVYFIRRELPLMKREAPESDVLTATETIPERRSTHPFSRTVHIGVKEYFEDADGLLMRAYAVGKARVLDRPPGIESDEHWVHIDLSEQVLVAYVGDRPVLATLVSTGKKPEMTPVGVHRVQSKHIATSMRDQPPEDEAYSIEDVPWTQYFHNNVALHGAFWHGAFGLVRSHGCVNLSPPDARWLFGFLRPGLPAGWYAVFADVGGNGAGSPIVVTE